MDPLVARRTFPYAGQTVTEGQRFIPRSAFDAVALRAAGHAVDVPDDDQTETVMPRPRRKRTPDPE